MCEFILFLALFIGVPVGIYHLCVLLVGLAGAALAIFLYALAFVFGAITLLLEGLAFALEALTLRLEA
ncbi:MAG: hypothetical protein OXH92_08610 [Bryobacterales bacterium]|nr:hypothetical protein [Bryobacterales bacterium]